jgi:F-type H+-transporting ATPase subunit gamma
MATLRDIRRRIKSIKSTSQITRAMQMVAAAKMKKAQDQALAGRDYAALLNQVLRNLKAKVNEEAHPLLQKRAGTRELMLVISTDKGLLGALNTNLGKKIRLESSDSTEFATVGRKLRTSLAKSGRTLVADFIVKDPVPFGEARPIAKFLTEKFLSGQYDRITVAFTNFVTTLTQEPWISQLLPIEPGKLAEKQDYEGVGHDEKPESAAPAADYLFEPSPEGVLDTLLPLYVNFQIYQMLVESRASEHSARMVAMKSATDNAKEIVKDLTLEYNKLRQAAITAELLEITTAQKAME